MPKKHLNILVDTNVWLDYLLGRQGASHARMAMEAAIEHEDALIVTPAILKDVFFLIGATLKQRAREAGHEITGEVAEAINMSSWACLSRIQGDTAILNVGFGEHLEAMSMRASCADYEDDLLLAAALSANADYVLTNEKALLANTQVPALTPQQYADLRNAHRAHN